MILFVVKGGDKTAHEQCELRGIVLEAAAESETARETYCLAQCSEQRKITAWYCEGQSPSKEGDCLFYTDRK